MAPWPVIYIISMYIISRSKGIYVEINNKLAYLHFFVTLFHGIFSKKLCCVAYYVAKQFIVLHRIGDIRTGSIVKRSAYKKTDPQWLSS